MVAAERRQVDERVEKIIELKNKVCSHKNFLMINQNGIDPPSLDLLARAGDFDKYSITTGARVVVEAAVGNASLFASGIITLPNEDKNYVTAHAVHEGSQQGELS